MSISESINLVLLQYKPKNNYDENLIYLNKLISKIKAKKNVLVVCPELSLQRYICITKNYQNNADALHINSKIIKDLKSLSIKYQIYLSITFFEKTKINKFNTCIVINPNGHILLKYHKKHIPSEKCFEEKYYFNESRNNFKYFLINDMKVGIMICWDQWHSLSYQSLKRKNVNLIICPTAIGSCKVNDTIYTLKDEKKKWIKVIEANSLMTNIPVAICNRIGSESDGDSKLKFWGGSFVTNASGEIISKLGLKEGSIHIEIKQKDQINAQKMWNFIDIN